MNREAVALGVPVYTTFQGRMGGVDEKLLREGRLRRLERASDVEIRRRDRSAERLRRDPQLIVDLILGAPEQNSHSNQRRACGALGQRVEQPLVVVLDRVDEHRGVGGVHLLAAG